jgi:hypothetical protein
MHRNWRTLEYSYAEAISEDAEAISEDASSAAVLRTGTIERGLVVAVREGWVAGNWKGCVGSCIGGHGRSLGFYAVFPLELCVSEFWMMVFDNHCILYQISRALDRLTVVM